MAAFLKFLGEFLAGMFAGEKRQQAKETTATLNALKDRETVDEKIAATDPDVRRDQLLKWTRG